MTAQPKDRAELVELMRAGFNLAKTHGSETGCEQMLLHVEAAGLRVVPVELTARMALKADEARCHRREIDREWRTMIAASPYAPEK